MKAKQEVGNWVCFMAGESLFTGYVLDATPRSVWVKVSTMFDRKMREFVPARVMMQTIKVCRENVVELETLLAVDDLNSLIDYALSIKDFKWVSELNVEKQRRLEKKSFLIVGED